jgi:RNA polymerase sigma-70 factor (ECF subfamily)
MASYQAGDASAFERLYGEIARPVLGYLQSLTRDVSRAEDLLQETFFHVHRARHTYDPQRSAKAWIFAIAHNVFLMYCRAAKRLSRHEDLAPEELPEVPVPAEVEGLADRELIRRALVRLPEDRREALVLHHIEGLSFKEIAAVQGVSTGAAKLRAHRGMNDLRELLQGKGR